MSTASPAVNIVAEQFAEISALAATMSISYEGPDQDGALQFRMPSGTPLLLQDEATRWARRIYDVLMSSKFPAVCDFVERAPAFKILAPR